ncbi:hypothetical protein H5410_039024 [Solanum commersonii]|uniref:Uncharacterized protein n=1 Tax=Solanum commersonii TaxID=4109 RepID=A0A9J5YDX3_SOLCO|nr:hypothetical protein H5410_039024 [Solanum commersonii]
MVCRQRSASMLEILPLSAASLQRQTSPDLAEFRRKVSDVPSGMYEMYILKKITFHHGDMGEGWALSGYSTPHGCCHPQLLANKDHHGLGGSHLVLNLVVAIDSVGTFNQLQPSVLWTTQLGTTQIKTSPQSTEMEHQVLG